MNSSSGAAGWTGRCKHFHNYWNCSHAYATAWLFFIFNISAKWLVTGSECNFFTVNHLPVPGAGADASHKFALGGTELLDERSCSQVWINKKCTIQGNNTKQLDCNFAWRANRFNRRCSQCPLLLRLHFLQLIWPYCFLLTAIDLLADHLLFLGKVQKGFLPTALGAVEFNPGDWCQVAYLDVRAFAWPALGSLNPSSWLFEHPCTPTGKAGEISPGVGQT